MQTIQPQILHFPSPSVVEDKIRLMHEEKLFLINFRPTFVKLFLTEYHCDRIENRFALGFRGTDWNLRRAESRDTIHTTSTYVYMDVLPPLWILKLINFLAAGSSTCILPYLALYVYENQLNNAVLGIMTVTGSITSLVSTIVMGKLADRPNVGAPIVFLIVSIGTLVSTVAMNFSLVKQTSVSIIAVWVVASAFLFGQMAFVDTFVLHVCKYYGSRTSFVEQRLWSSIGNVVLSPLTGLAVSLFDLWGMFGMFAISNVLMVLLKKKLASKNFGYLARCEILEKSCIWTLKSRNVVAKLY